MTVSVVTGGAGFIGRHLTKALLDDGDRVTVLDNLSAPGSVCAADELRAAGARLLVGSVLDPDLLDQALTGADCAYHLAAIARVPVSVESPLLTHAVNATGTLQTLEACRRQEVKRFVFASSSSVYGRQNDCIMTEKLTPAPLSPYGVQKLAGEHYVSVYAQLYGLTATSLRFFNVYGPGMSTDLVIGRFLAQRDAGQPMTVHGAGRQIRDYTFVDDVVSAAVNAGGVENVGRARVLNVGAGEGTSLLALVGMLGGEFRHIPNPRGDMDEERKIADVSYIGKALGWRPEIGLEEGLARCAAAASRSGGVHRQ